MWEINYLLRFDESSFFMEFRNTILAHPLQLAAKSLTLAGFCLPELSNICVLSLDPID